MKLQFLLTTAPLVSLTTLVAADAALRNWPAWRGPLANGVAPEAKPPVEWSETKNVKWKVKLPGRGTSTPVIWDNQVFLLTAIPAGKKAETKPAIEPAAAA